MKRNNFSRRDFLKLAGASLGAMAMRPLERTFSALQFPEDQKLGRVSVTHYFYSTDIKATPNLYAASVATLPEDSVVEWLRVVVGGDGYSNSKRWVETPQGYIFLPHLQPVYNRPNTVLTAIPEGQPGMWVEVTVPYVDLYAENATVSSPSINYILSLGQTPRLYYSQVVWIDRIRIAESGQVQYRFNEDLGHGYGYGDVFWADGAAFRVLSEEEVAPISSHIDPAEKKIVVNVTYQTLSCYEQGHEVFFCRISSGAGEFGTPTGSLYTWWKTPSIHMSANTASDSGYDTPGVSWPTFISGSGVAIHAAFWHNDFGTRRSHGCINVCPKDAKWIYCWTTPHVSLAQSEIKMQWPDVGTEVVVEERSF
ncbi:MAG: L,D-transpeptidase family protein [Anaerolineales bacterium]|nr:L,D-transpeptidase family protein [Anaerolineales bacterium]